MSLYVTALNSGSNGNCYYIGNEDEAVLIDVGISCREVVKRLKRLEVPMNRIKAIFVSHEHADHVRGIRVLSSKFNLPVYITRNTLAHARLSPVNPNLVELEAFQEVSIGNLHITAFPKQHDAADPHSFVISNRQVNVGVLTDIGAPCDHVIHYFKQCHAVFLEANYDEEMLEAGHYPYFLKNRIRSEAGHMSNRQAYELFLQHRPAFMTHVFLSHLSKDNNTPERALGHFATDDHGVKVLMTSRDNEIPIARIALDEMVAG